MRSRSTGAVRSSAAEPTWGEGSGSTCSPVRRDHGTARDLALAEAPVRLAGALEGEVLDQHLDLARLGEIHHLHELAEEAPVGRGDGTLVRRAGEVDRYGSAAESDDGQVATHPGHLSSHPQSR